MKVIENCVAGHSLWCCGVHTVCFNYDVVKSFLYSLVAITCSVGSFLKRKSDNKHSWVFFFYIFWKAPLKFYLKDYDN